MNIPVNKFKQLVATSLLIGGFIQAQIPEGPSVKVSSATFSKDTAEAKGNNRTLNFRLSIKDVANLKSITTSLIDKSEKTIVDLGEYEVKKHATGFYFIENKFLGKKTVLNDEVHFSQILNPDQLQIKNIKLSYRSKSDSLQTTIAVLPNN